MTEHPGFEDHAPFASPDGGPPSSAVPQDADPSGGPSEHQRSNQVADGATGHSVADPAMANQDQAGWETVNFPGQRPLAELELPLQDTAPTSTSAPTGLNTAELLQLIQDLNQCNDVLLSRISELEDALEHSQHALQSEVERAQTAGPAQAPAAPQLAQLLKELEAANDTLRQVSRHNEVLTTDLNQSHQRVGQIERECTRLQQRLNERSDALHQTETTCRDLRTRLHRQQRYTLQFKVALEKCLNMSAEQAVADLSQSLPDPANQPIAMPKAQQIQPWAADPQSPSADASLTHMLRGLKAAGQGLPATPSEHPPLPLEPEPTDADAALWEQLERLTTESTRVLDTEAPQAPSSPSAPLSPSPMPDIAAPAESAPPPEVTPADPINVGFTEPSPWGNPLPSAQPSTSPDAASLVADLMAELQTTADASGGEPVAADATVEQDRLGANLDQFPTPSAVEPRLASPASDSISDAEPTFPPYSEAAALPPAVPADSLDASSLSPSPVVYPLRHKKKLGSLAAVQLPNFSQHRRPS